jgi:type IV pilus assembly protein PilQ
MGCAQEVPTGSLARQEVSDSSPSNPGKLELRSFFALVSMRLRARQENVCVLASVAVAVLGTALASCYFAGVFRSRTAPTAAARQQPPQSGLEPKYAAASPVPGRLVPRSSGSRYPGLSPGVESREAGGEGYRGAYRTGEPNLGGWRECAARVRQVDRVPSGDGGRPVQGARYMAMPAGQGAAVPGRLLVADVDPWVRPAVAELPSAGEGRTQLTVRPPESTEQQATVSLPGRTASTPYGSQAFQPGYEAGQAVATDRGLAPLEDVYTMAQGAGPAPGAGLTDAPPRVPSIVLRQLRQALSTNQSPAADNTATIPLAGSLPPDAVRADADSGLVYVVVRDAPLSEILNLLADQLGLNVVTGDDVTARISVTLKNVPFEEALNHLLSVTGYTWVRQGNVLIVTSIAAASKLAPQAQGRQLRVFSLNYVSAADIDAVIQGLLSPVGQCFTSESTESDNRQTQELVIVEDLPGYLSRIEQYVRQVDRPPRQVLIEARVMSIELDDEARHGINFEYLDSRNPSVTLTTQGFADVAKYAAGEAPAFFANLSATDLNGLIELLEATTDAKTLATPKVLALNGQQARIQIGERIGYKVTTTTQTNSTESVNFLEVGIVLDVIPWITEDDNVLMQVVPKVSTGQINPETDLPDEETTEVETALMLPDGYGMVIGGLIQEEDSESQQKIPVLGDLWLVGRLFQRRELKRRRNEIIITLIPHIVPYQPGRHQRECEQFYRATTPLVYGPLRQNPRPAEPRFSDAGQKLPLSCKVQRLHAPPDRGAWAPQMPEEPCLPGLAPMAPAGGSGVSSGQIPAIPEGLLEGDGPIPAPAVGPVH